MCYCALFLLNCQSMEPHLGLESDGAFWTEFALNKDIFQPSQGPPPAKTQVIMHGCQSI